MSVKHTVERLKELATNYDDALVKFRRQKLTTEVRLHLMKIRKDTLHEMITLIKRIP